MIQRTAKSPEQFVKGATEGLIALETPFGVVLSVAMVLVLVRSNAGQALSAMILSAFCLRSVIFALNPFQNRENFAVAFCNALLVLGALRAVFVLMLVNLLVQNIRTRTRFLGNTCLTLAHVGGIWCVNLWCNAGLRLGSGCWDLS